MMAESGQRLLIHTCCAHCLGQVLAGLTQEAEKWAPLIFWYNPNIHPLLEYRRRLKAVKMLGERTRLPLMVEDTYGLVEFCRAVHGRENAPERCGRCYELRLGRAARAAREAGIAVFTTTLLASRHQDHGQIRAAGEAAAASAGVTFLCRDWRLFSADPVLLHMLYHQQYCGCIFSEYDRYRHTTTHLWPPESRPPS